MKVAVGIFPPVPLSSLELFCVILHKLTDKTSNKQKQVFAHFAAESPPAGSYQEGARARSGIRTQRTRAGDGKEHTPPSSLPFFGWE